MNENLFSCLISGGSFSHMTVIRDCLLPSVCSHPCPMEVFFCGISCVVAMNIFGILLTCVKDIWLCLRVPMMSEFQSMKFENVFYVKNLKKIY